MGLQKAILEGKLAPYPWRIFGKNPAEMEWKTVSGSFDEFCKKIISGILLHRTLAHSLKTRMGRGSIFFARNPARQIWAGGNRYDGFQSEDPWHRCGQSWRTVKADDGGVWEPGVWFDPRVARGGQDLLLCKRCGESVGVCESLRRSETPLQRPPNETRGGRSEGASVWYQYSHA